MPSLGECGGSGGGCGTAENGLCVSCGNELPTCGRETLRLRTIRFDLVHTFTADWGTVQRRPRS